MSRTNFRVKVGSYTGTGAAASVTDVGFAPTLVIVKGGANVACFRTRQMQGNSTAYLAGNTANFADGITGLTANGFTLGTDAKANAAGTTYYYVAFWGAAAQEYFRTFRYWGNGTDDRSLTTALGLKFTPTFAWIKGNRADNPSVRTDVISGDNSWHFSGTADASNELQSFVTEGIQVGTSSRVNSNGSEYFGVAFKSLAGVIRTFSFIGDGSDNRSITGIGFKPDFIILKNAATTNAAVIRTSAFSGDSSASAGSSAPSTDMIQKIESDGFQLGTHASVNNSGSTIYGVAFKAGDFNVPIVRSSA